MSYEDYIDEYYESAMTAEKLYDRFIEVALELQKWIDEIDDVVEVCKRLDLLGKSEQIWYDCKNRVFGK